MDEHLDNCFSYGDDSLPLISRVEDPPPAGWGKLTSTARTCSAAYLKFLGKDKDVSTDSTAG